MLYRTLPSLPGIIRGMNISPNIAYGDWPPFWAAFPWTGQGGFKTQIDLAKSVGCNCIRIITNCGVGSWIPSTGTLSQFLAKLSQVVSYCLSQGMWYYGSMAWNHIPPTSDVPTIFNDFASYSASYCATLAGFPNVWGCDLSNEFLFENANGLNTRVDNSQVITFTTAQMQSGMAQIIAAIRPVAPSLALSASYGMLFNDSSAALYNSMFDFLDYHGYLGTNPSAGDSAALYLQSGASGKPFWIGETGYTMNQFPSNRLVRMQAYYNNVVNVTYSGQPGCRGMNEFCVLPYDSRTAEDYGIWDSANPAVDRGDITPTYSTYPAMIPLISFPKIWGM